MSVRRAATGAEILKDILAFKRGYYGDRYEVLPPVEGHSRRIAQVGVKRGETCGNCRFRTPALYCTKDYHLLNLEFIACSEWQEKGGGDHILDVLGNIGGKQTS